MTQIRLMDLVEKVLLQATKARDYIKSQPKVKFLDESKKQILIEIDSSKTNYEFFGHIFNASSYLGVVQLR